VDIECFARDLEDRGTARATVARRLCTVVGFYRYAEEEGVIDHSPAAHIRRPRIDCESHVAHLDRNELGALLVAACLSSPRDHALVSLLALNACPRRSAPISTPSDSSVVIAPSLWSARAARPPPCPSPHASPAPSTWRSVTGATGRSSSRPTVAGSTVTSLGGSCAGSPAEPGSPSGSVRTRCVTPSSRPPWTPACPFATCKRPPATPTRDRGRQSLDRHATYVVATFIAGASR
jgi:integrase/recombinase XerD